MATVSKSWGERSNVLARETARDLSTWKILIFRQIVVVEKTCILLLMSFFFEYESKIHESY